MLVISINTNTAEMKYPATGIDSDFQFRYRYEAVIILPTSNVAPMMMIDQNAPAKIAVSPMIEYQAEMPDIAIPASNANALSIFEFEGEAIIHV